MISPDWKTDVVKRLKLIAPQLADISDETAEMFAEDAIQQAVADGFPDEDVVRGASYLAAHYANLASNQDSNISKQTASVLSVEYFDRGGSDDYLKEYLRLKNSVSGSIIRFM